MADYLPWTQLAAEGLGKRYDPLLTLPIPFVKGWQIFIINVHTINIVLRHPVGNSVGKLDSVDTLGSGLIFLAKEGDDDPDASVVVLLLLLLSRVGR